jgi:hypothetical protein
VSADLPCSDEISEVNGVSTEDPSCICVSEEGYSAVQRHRTGTGLTFYEQALYTCAVITYPVAIQSDYSSGTSDGTYFASDDELTTATPGLTTGI